MKFNKEGDVMACGPSHSVRQVATSLPEKILYFKLLVQAIKDDDHIANRVSQARMAAPHGSLESKQPPLPAALGKPGLLKSLWFWFLVILAMGLFVVALPYLFDGRASVWGYLIAGFWLLVANYALKKLFPKAKS